MITDSQMLNHIYQSTQMGRESILSVLRHAEQSDFYQALQQQLAEYNQIYHKAEEMLQDRGFTAEDINPLVKLNAQITGAIKSGVNDSPAHIAEMMIQGNTKGATKSIQQLGDYEGGDKDIRALAEKLLSTEQNNIEQMKGFLS